MKSKRLQKIIEDNLKFEKQTPFNFCDRFCERCPYEKQDSCRLYRDEFEQKITCVAYGKDPYDPEITHQVMEQQFKEVEDRIQRFQQDNDVDFDETVDSYAEQMEQLFESVDNNPLSITAKTYCSRSGNFLKETFFDKKDISSELVYDFQTISWYHTLIPVKLNRALSGINQGLSENEYTLHDVVAQFAICRKSINESIKALQKINAHLSDYKNIINELVIILRSILSRIEQMEDQI